MGGPNCKFLSEIVGVATFYNSHSCGQNQTRTKQNNSKKDISRKLEVKISWSKVNRNTIIFKLTISMENLLLRNEECAKQVTKFFTVAKFQGTNMLNKKIFNQRTYNIFLKLLDSRYLSKVRYHIHIYWRNPNP